MKSNAVSLSFNSMETTQNPATSHTPRKVIQRVSLGGIPAQPKSTEVLSKQQEAILDFVKNGAGSGLVDAKAGTGKTFILLRACQAIPSNKRIAVMAYNKSIATEIEDKVATLGLSNVTVRTCHSFGLATIKAIHRNVRPDAAQKKRRMLENIKAPDSMREAVAKLISIAKQSAVGVLWEESNMCMWQELIERFDILVDIKGANGGFATEAQLIDALVGYAINGLAYSQETAHYQVDFDDMLWIPLVEDMQMVTYDWVIGDEVQDFNAVRRLIAAKMMRPGSSRALFAGDRNQAIYAFSGADSASVDFLLDDFDAIEMPLTTTYRCSRAATAVAQEFVPTIEAGKDNKEGSVESLTMEKFESMVAENKVGGGDAILCRLTKPLVKLCLKLIAAGVPAFVEGRDIGRSLDALVRKWDVESTGALVKCLESYRLSETRRLIEQGKEYAIDSVDDRVDSLLAIMSDCDTVADVRAKITRLFDDSADKSGKDGRVLLCTVHRSKGREWERVFVVGWTKLMPSKRAKQPYEQQAERNLMYVAVTRTKNHLVLVD